MQHSFHKCHWLETLHFIFANEALEEDASTCRSQVLPVTFGVFARGLRISAKAKDTYIESPKLCLWISL